MPEQPPNKHETNLSSKKLMQAMKNRAGLSPLPEAHSRLSQGPQLGRENDATISDMPPKKEGAPKANSAERNSRNVSKIEIANFKERLLSDEFDATAIDEWFSGEERDLAMDEKVSPLFDAEGKLVEKSKFATRETENLFRALLKSEGWPPMAVDNLISWHIRPLGVEIRRLFDEQHSEPDTPEKPKGKPARQGAAGLKAAVEEEAANKEISPMTKIHQVVADRLQLMRSIYLHPKEFDIDPADFEKRPGELKLETSELKNRLVEKRFDQAFVVSGRMMTPANIRDLSKEYLHEACEQADKSEIADILIAKCLQPFLDNLNRVFKLSNKQIDYVRRQHILSSIHTEIAALLADLTLESEKIFGSEYKEEDTYIPSGETGYDRYADLILDGPTAVDLDAFPIISGPNEKPKRLDIPSLRLGLPKNVTVQMKVEPEKASEIKFKYYLETLVDDYDLDRIRDLEAKYVSDDTREQLSVFRDEQNPRVRKPLYLRSAEMIAVLEYTRDYFGRARASAFVNDVTSAAFKKSYPLLEEKRTTKDNKRKREIQRELRQIELDLIQYMREALDETDGPIIAGQYIGHDELSIPDMREADETGGSDAEVDGAPLDEFDGDDGLAIEDFESKESRLKFFDELQTIVQQELQDIAVEEGFSFQELVAREQADHDECIRKLDNLKNLLESNDPTIDNFKRVYAEFSVSFEELKRKLRE